jgi:thiol-disulfide isomerase/thioredoxin
MKQLLFIITLVSLSLPSAARGITFEELSYADALAKAGRENKLLFVDCYTTWCAPCKKMAAEVFTLQEAGDYFTPRLVAVKYDMEKGDGVALAKQFGIRAYPTFLVIRPDGTIAHRVIGSSPWPEFMQKVARGLDPATCLHDLDLLYKQGKLDNKGLLRYRLALQDAGDAAAEKTVSDALVKNMTDKERLSPEAWTLMGNVKVSPFPSANHDFILAHRKKLEKNVGRERVDAYLHAAWSTFLTSLRFIDRPDAIDIPPPANPTEVLQQLKQQIAGMNVSRKEFMLAKCAAAEATLKGDRETLKKVIEESFPLMLADDKGEILGWINLAGRSREANAEMADLYEKYLAALPGDKYPEWVMHNSLTYRKHATPGLCFEPFTFDEALSWGTKRWESPVYVWLHVAGDASCRKMEKFFAGEAAQEASRSAVCVKYDLSSPEGQRLREQYNLPAASPAHLLLKPDGTEISRLAGTSTGTDFVAWMKENAKRETR